MCIGGYCPAVAQTQQSETVLFLGCSQGLSFSKKIMRCHRPFQRERDADRCAGLGPEEIRIRLQENLPKRHKELCAFCVGCRVFVVAGG